MDERTILNEGLKRGDYSTASLVLAASAVVIVAYILQALISAWVKSAREGRALKSFDGPPGSWLLGAIGDLPPDDEVLDYIVKWNKYGAAHKVRMGPFRHSVRLIHHDFLECILKTAEPKDMFIYRWLEPWIGDGLLLSRGQKWARNRRLLTPAFHFDILKPYTEVFNDCTHVLIKKWRRLLNDTSSLEMFEHVSLLTLDSILKCIFNYRGDCQNEGKRNPYIKSVYDLADIFAKRFRIPLYYIDFIFHMTPMGYRFRQACNNIHAYSRAVIKSRKESRVKHEEVEKKRLDFLDMLLDARDEDGKGLTDTEIQHEVDTFMFEGHDTTASAISFCLYNLARHSEYQQRCRDEVNMVLQERNHVTWDDLQKFEYLTMCIKESMRLHSTVPFIGRQLFNDLPLPDGRSVKAGLIIDISMFSIHRNAEVWEDPDVYNPERFTQANSAGRSPYAFVPFSAGPRNCIGQHFAMSELRVCLALLLKNFNFDVDESKPVLPVPELVLRTKNGLWLKPTLIET